MTKVPDGLVGQTKDAALKTLQDAKFSVTVEEAYSDSVASGQVISVDPDSNTSVAQRSSVTLTISKGKEPATVPNVSDGSWTYAEASQILKQYGFNVKQSGSTGSNDYVIAQSPAANTQTDKGSTITLTTESSSSSGGSNR